MAADSVNAENPNSQTSAALTWKNSVYILFGPLAGCHSLIVEDFPIDAPLFRDSVLIRRSSLDFVSLAEFVSPLFE